MIGTFTDNMRVYNKWYQKYPLRGYESRYAAILFFPDVSPIGNRELNLVNFKENHGISDKDAANIHKKVKLRHERYLSALAKLRNYWESGQ